MDAVATVETEVRELIRRSGLDPAREPLAVRRLVDEAVADYDERSLHGGLPTLPDPEEAAKAVWDLVAGFGPLQPYFDDPSVEEIWVNEPGRVFVARGGVAELTTTILTAGEVRDLVERMLKHLAVAGSTCPPRSSTRCWPTARGCTSSSRTSPGAHWPVNIRKFVVRRRPPRRARRASARSPRRPPVSSRPPSPPG